MFGAVKAWLGRIKLTVQVVESWMVEVIGVAGDNGASYSVRICVPWNARVRVTVRHRQ